MEGERVQCQKAINSSRTASPLQGVILLKGIPMNRESLQVWLNKYVDAWRTYDPEQIADLFSEDALYFYSPFDEHVPVRGRNCG